MMIKAYTAVTAVAILFAFSLTFYGAERAGSPDHGVDRSRDQEGEIKYYHNLDKLYVKWHDGLFGSRRFHERSLRNFLNDLRGSNIRTDYNYIIDQDASGKVIVVCRFSGCRWLNIYGPVDGDSLKRVTRGNPARAGEWWRGTELLAVSGRVKRYRLGRNRYGDTISLYLEKIYLHGDK